MVRLWEKHKEVNDKLTSLSIESFLTKMLFERAASSYQSAVKLTPNNALSNLNQTYCWSDNNIMVIIRTLIPVVQNRDMARVLL